MKIGIDVRVFNTLLEADVFKQSTSEFNVDFLEEDQYARLDEWCKTVLQGRGQRTGYQIFSFDSLRELEWFSLRWSGVDIDSV